jgi:hypothetical protein
MSNTEVTATEQPPSKPAALGLTTKQVLQDIRDNFVMVSAGAVIAGVGLASIFVASYLSVFDWHLLWFVQYTDIVTFGLVVVGIIGGSILVVQSLTQTVLGAVAMQGKSKRRSIIILVVISLLLLASQLYWPILHGEPYFHIISGLMVMGGAVFLTYLIVAQVRAGAWPNTAQMTGLIIIVITTATAFGQWLGNSVIETSQFDQDIFLKDGTIKAAKLVIVLSRHTVLLKDRMLYVVPTSDITKFQTSHELITIIPPSTK